MAEDEKKAMKKNDKSKIFLKNDQHNRLFHFVTAAR